MRLPVGALSSGGAPSGGECSACRTLSPRWSRRRWCLAATTHPADGTSSLGRFTQRMPRLGPQLSPMFAKVFGMPNIRRLLGCFLRSAPRSAVAGRPAPVQDHVRRNPSVCSGCGTHFFRYLPPAGRAMSLLGEKPAGFAQDCLRLFGMPNTLATMVAPTLVLGRRHASRRRYVFGSQQFSGRQRVASECRPLRECSACRTFGGGAL